MKNIERIGFIGTGIMGSAMASNLMKAGFKLQVYNRTKSKAKSLIDAGAEWKNTARECAEGADVVITIVGYPKDVEEVYFGSDTAKGIIDSASEGTYLIDMTTSSPTLAVKIHDEALKQGVHALDAPVTGGDTGAKAGTLTILVGGDKDDFDAVLPVLKGMGKTISYMGKAGSGQHTKLCNQIAIAGALAGACEAITYADAAGLDVNLVLDTISTGAAGSFQLSNVAAQAAKGNYAPGFMMKHFVKDMNLGLGEAEERGIDLNVLKMVDGICSDLADTGHSEEGTQALLKHYEHD